MNKYILTTIMIVALMIVPISAEEIEIRSEIATGDMVYDYQNFAALWMDLDKNMSSEVITITTSGTGNRTIVDGALTYVCVPKLQNYKNPVLVNTYEIVGFLGTEYVVFDRSNELVKLLEEWDNNDKKTLAVGDSYLMPEGMEFKIREIDLEGNKVYVQLLKDGTEIDSEIITNGGTYTYEIDDVLVFSVCLDSVFRGTDSNFCQITYIWLISQDVMEVKSSDNYGELEVTSTNPITLDNDGIITLGPGDEIDLTDDLIIRVADNDTILLYYIAKVIELPICPTCPECDDCEPCVNQTPCEPCPEVTPEVIVNETVVYVEVPAEPVKEAPGFSGILPLLGLGVVAYLIVRQRD